MHDAVNKALFIFILMCIRLPNFVTEGTHTDKLSPANLLDWIWLGHTKRLKITKLLILLKTEHYTSYANI